MFKKNRVPSPPPPIQSKRQDLFSTINSTVQSTSTSNRTVGAVEEGRKKGFVRVCVCGWNTLSSMWFLTHNTSTHAILVKMLVYKPRGANTHSSSPPPPRLFSALLLLRVFSTGFKSSTPFSAFFRTNLGRDIRGRGGLRGGKRVCMCVCACVMCK